MNKGLDPKPYEDLDLNPNQGLGPKPCSGLKSPKPQLRFDPLPPSGFRPSILIRVYARSRTECKNNMHELNQWLLFSSTTTGSLWN